MERVIRRTLAALVLALLALGVMTGEGQAGKLTKVTNVKFTVAGVDEGGQACGLTQDRLQHAFLGPLGGSGVKVVESAPYFFFIRTTTISFLTDYCITYVNAELLLGQRYFNPATNDNQVGLIRLWFNGTLIVTVKEEHPQEIDGAFDSLGRAFVEAWKRDQ